MGLFTGILKAAVNVATMPVAIAVDVVTDVLPVTEKPTKLTKASAENIADGIVEAFGDDE